MPYKLQIAERFIGPFPYCYTIPNTTLYPLSEIPWASGPSKLRAVGLVFLPDNPGALLGMLIGHAYVT
jgi:hypothetical protein